MSPAFHHGPMQSTPPPRRDGTEVHAEPLDAPAAASAWVLRFATLFEPGTQVLDLACGSGRHVRALAASGHPVLGVDRDAQALETLRDLPGVRVLLADLENAPWPLQGRRFGAVVVTNYLWRPLLPRIVESVAVGGVLVYETFALGQQALGRPRNPEFLLRPRELLDVTRGQLRVIAYEDGFVQRAQGAFVQRICAVREAGDGARAADPPKYNL